MKTLNEYINENLINEADNSKLREWTKKSFEQFIKYIDSQRYNNVENDIMSAVKYLMQDTLDNLEYNIDDAYKLNKKDVIDSIISNVEYTIDKNLKIKRYKELDSFLGSPADEFIANEWKNCFHKNMPNPYM